MRDVTYTGRDGCALYAASVGHGPPVVLLHGGGPDHRSLLPLAHRLADSYHVVLPDVRGYGRSVCADPARHTWAGYVDDVAALCDHLGVDTVVLGGTGLGATVSLRAALAHPERVRAQVLISVEDIERDEAKRAEIEVMEAFARRVRTDGVEEAWATILVELAPIIGSMVRDAIPRCDPESVAAAAAIGRDRSFRTVEELAPIMAPTLIFPGVDQRHPTRLAERLAELLPNGQLARTAFGTQLRTAEELASAVAPTIRTFLVGLGADRPVVDDSP
ncbi:MAG: alpha/beta hydrolase [Pseudonocardia sp.]|nr:alpha/beta hydrolase [Pseudonocardia sp.]